MYKPIEPFSVAQYKAALDMVADKLSAVHRRMLQVQYEAPGRVVTAAELAQALGYTRHSFANLHYGRLARLLAIALNCTSPPLDDGVERWWPVLSAGVPGTSTHAFQWAMHAQLAQALEEGGWVKVADYTLPEEITVSEAQTLREGAIRQVQVNAYERNPVARQRCIAHYGAVCYVCGFNFTERYGRTGEGVIHVHHERPLSTIGETYEVDPIADLKPVCPNCHAIIHRRTPAYTIEEVRAMLRKP
jgi:putative restriction endonuclease